MWNVLSNVQGELGLEAGKCSSIRITCCPLLIIRNGKASSSCNPVLSDWIGTRPN